MKNNKSCQKCTEYIECKIYHNLCLAFKNASRFYRRKSITQIVNMVMGILPDECYNYAEEQKSEPIEWD